MTETKHPVTPRRIFRALASNRLAQFLAIGAALFAVAPPPESPRSIHIDESDMVALQAAEARRIGTPQLSDKQAQRLRAGLIDDELLYREALRLGIDKSDIVVRRRLIQRVRMLAQDLAGASNAPSEQELRSWFAATRQRWRSQPKLRFVHVFIRRNSKRDVAALRSAAIAHDQASTSNQAPPPLGDAFPISRLVPLTSLDDLEPMYGSAFVTAVQALSPRSWSQPIASKLGRHLVKVIERAESQPATFEQVRQKVRLAYALEQKQRAVEAFLSAARRRYDIDIAGPALRSSGPVARRQAAEPRSVAMGSAR